MSFPLEKKPLTEIHGNKKNDISIRDELYLLKKRSPTPETLKKNTKTSTYQNSEKLREIITMNNFKYARVI